MVAGTPTNAASQPAAAGASHTQRVELASAVIRFAGDSGDGMQLAGSQFTDTSAIAGNDVATLPDFPAEIRAPAGTVPGVSGFQINFSSQDIHTPGDEVNALIAMNPAAFKAHIQDVQNGGVVVVNDSEFDKVNLRKAGYPEGYNPLDDSKYQDRYKIYRVPISRLNDESLAGSGMTAKDTGRCKNMWALGLIYFLYDRSLDTTIKYLDDYFGKKKKLPQVAEANIKALKAGYYFGETAEIFPVRYHVGRAPVSPGTYRKVTGNEATAMGLVTASKLSGKTLIYCTYPITPASDILHDLATMRHMGVKTFQAEDEIAAVCAAIGVAFAGQLAVTGTSGPGLALKSEAIGLAVMTELPLVVIDVQRGGPSTGLPTKTEQSDLLQAMFGRNGDCPVIVLAAQSPADCFNAAIEAVRLAFKHMAPVLLLTDGYIANGSEPWKVPDASSFEKIPVSHPTDAASFKPYQRDEHLARPWAIPGTPGLEHRIGGLEKADITGAVSYDPANHHRMTELRAAKIVKVVDDVPPAQVYGPEQGDLLVVGWGGTYGSIRTAVERAQHEGRSVAGLHMRHLNPMPANLGQVFRRYKKVLVPELNTGQLRMLLRARYLIDARGLNKIYGKPFLVEEIHYAIEHMLSGQWGDRESIPPQPHALEASAPAQELHTGG
ncbi:MAG: 2-oxoacid:acceptor oxidoreductase subunit alpha [Phycisphaeraceae bacterium]|nr:2-oxoacid:acceptor oxidoreductase subunit alpha [Phycisphaeraceae bacterium]